MILSTLFVNPMTIPSSWQIWLMLPLCASVAIVYKTVRVSNLQRLPRELVSLFFFYVVGGLVALALLLWILFQLFL